MKAHAARERMPANSENSTNCIDVVVDRLCALVTWSCACRLLVGHDPTTHFGIFVPEALIRKPGSVVKLLLRIWFARWTAVVFIAADVF
jgi:hypothetical protein